MFQLFENDSFGHDQTIHSPRESFGNDTQKNSKIENSERKNCHFGHKQYLSSFKK